MANSPTWVRKDVPWLTGLRGMDCPRVYRISFPSNTWYYNKFSNEACSNPFRKKQLYSPNTWGNGTAERQKALTKPFRVRGGQLRTLERQRLAIGLVYLYCPTSSITSSYVWSAPVFLRRSFSQDGDRLCNYDLFKRSYFFVENPCVFYENSCSRIIVYSTGIESLCADSYEYT